MHICVHVNARGWYWVPFSAALHFMYSSRVLGWTQSLLIQLVQLATLSQGWVLGITGSCLIYLAFYVGSGNQNNSPQYLWQMCKPTEPPLQGLTSFSPPPLNSILKFLFNCYLINCEMRWLKSCLPHTSTSHLLWQAQNERERIEKFQGEVRRAGVLGGFTLQECKAEVLPTKPSYNKNACVHSRKPQHVPTGPLNRSRCSNHPKRCWTISSRKQEKFQKCNTGNETVRLAKFPGAEF